MKEENRMRIEIPLGADPAPDRRSIFMTGEVSVDPEANAGDLSDTLLARSDPFATREGKTLTWRDVNMTVSKRKRKDLKILNGVWGEVPKRQTTSIMGPSGSGKTSLLNILSGRAKSGGCVHIQADVRLDNFIVDPTNIAVRKQIAFVQQDDSLQVAATPRESIRFSAKLRLPRSTTNEELEALTTRMVNELGLKQCADTVVGGSLLKGISGGERKRTSVGVELVVRPTMIFLDEPVSLRAGCVESIVGFAFVTYMYFR
jgi:ABC-type glutathione transport system ATPase component